MKEHTDCHCSSCIIDEIRNHEIPIDKNGKCQCIHCKTMRGEIKDD